MVAAGVTDVRLTIAPPREFTAARDVLTELVAGFRAAAA
jgi:hypothetical protein